MGISSNISKLTERPDVKCNEFEKPDVSLTVLSLHFAGVEVFLLPCSRILEPHLRYPLAESSYMRYPFKVLPIRITIQLKIRLENGELLLGKSGPNSLRFIAALVTTLGVTAFCESTN